MECEIEKENCGTIETTLSLPQKICQINCRVCQSPCLEEIHQMKISGMQLSEIVTVVKKNYAYDVSKSSLSRHFQKFFEIRDKATAEILEKKLVPDAVKRAAHLSSVIGLIDKYLELLDERFKLGTVKVNIPDLQKLMDIRYKILDADNENDKPLAVIFENFFNKYKIDTAQTEMNFNRPSVVVGSSSPNEPQANEKTQDRKEAERV